MEYYDLIDGLLDYLHRWRLGIAPFLDGIDCSKHRALRLFIALLWSF